MNSTDVDKNENCLKKMLLHCNKKGYDIQGKLVDISTMIFEERVKMNCFYCGKYNSSWRCPPKIPEIDFKKMLSEYDSSAFIFVEKPLKDKDYSMVRTDSSVELHRALLECAKWLWENNNSTAVSFIGGSCKLCKNGCPQDRCVNPYESRSPVEALGINVVKSAEQCGINIRFPTREYMLRIGLLLW